MSTPQNYAIRRNGEKIGEVCCDSSNFFRDPLMGAIWYFIGCEMAELTHAQFDRLLGEFSAEAIGGAA